MENKLYKGGRPTKNEEERSEHRVCVRFSLEEFTQLVSLKSTTKSKDLSAFIRNVCLQKPLLMKTQLDTYQHEALSLLVEMRSDLLRIGINVNQSSKRINSTTDYYDLKHDVGEMTQNMMRIDQQLQQLVIALSETAQPTK